MIEVTVGQMFACMKPIMDLSRQEMDIVQAEKIADFVGVFIDKMVSLEANRSELLDENWADEKQRNAAFEEFAGGKEELPEFNFKEFAALRISPDALITLKRAGLYT